eukprot:5328489-Prymnesium_polylepis.1
MRLRARVCSRGDALLRCVARGEPPFHPVASAQVDQLMGEATLSSERRISYEVFKRVTQNGFGSS